MAWRALARQWGLRYDARCMFKLNTRKKLLIAGFLIVGVSVALYGALRSRGKSLQYDSLIVERGALVQEVSVTGSIKPETRIDLALEISGKIEKTPAAVGMRVEKGAVLAALSDTELSTELKQAEAQLQRARAEVQQYQAALDGARRELEKLKKGTRKEEVALTEIKVEKAKQALADAQSQLRATEEKGKLERGKAEQSLRDAEKNFDAVKNQTATDMANLYNAIPDILEDAYTKADDALHKQIDGLFNDDDSASPKLSFGTSNFQAQLKVESERVQAGKSLSELRKVVGTLPSSQDERERALKNAQSHLTAINEFLLQTADILNYAVNLSDTTLGTFKASVNTARANVSAAITAQNAHIQKIDGLEASNQVALQKAQTQLNDAKQAYDLVQKTTENERIASQTSVSNAEGALKIAEQELAVAEAGSRSEDIGSAKAKVAQAQGVLLAGEARVKEGESRVEQIQAQIQKTVLYSSIEGVVTRYEAQAGEIAAAHTPLVTVISDALTIEAFIPEVDSAKVARDDEAVFTLDAYGSDDEFRARVVAVDPAETVIDGVSSYKTTFELTEPDTRIKSGMTANLQILTDKRESALAIPERAVFTKDGEKFVRVVKRDAAGKVIFEKAPVVTGLRGSDGRVEIVSGIAEGAEVVLFVEP